MEVVTYDPVMEREDLKEFSGEHPLRRQNHEVQVINTTIKTLVSNMRDTLIESNGVGLAAPQVGVNFLLFLAKTEGSGIDCYLNPTIKHKHGRQKNWEGCLSLPGVATEVTRAQKINMEWYDLDGKLHVKNFSGDDAMVLQHEYDHLQGRLIIDYLPYQRTIKVTI